MANKRQEKKNTRKQLEQKAQKLKIPKKQIKKSSKKELEKQISQEEIKAKQEQRRLEKNRKQKAKRDNKKKIIEQRGLQGYLSPDTPDKDWDKALKRAVRAKRIDTKRNQLLNIPGILKDKILSFSDSKIDSYSYDEINHVSEYTHPELFKQQAKRQPGSRKTYTCDCGIWIGYFSNDGQVGVGYMLSTLDFYLGYTVEELKAMLPDLLSQEMDSGSSGKAGDFMILIDNSKTFDIHQMMQVYHKLEYSDIVMPGKLDWTPKEMLAMICACLEFGREDNRRTIYNELKQYFKTYGNGLGKFIP